jgi:hypothetical protein
VNFGKLVNILVILNFSLIIIWVFILIRGVEDIQVVLSESEAEKTVRVEMVEVKHEDQDFVTNHILVTLSRQTGMVGLDATLSQNVTYPYERHQVDRYCSADEELGRDEDGNEFLMISAFDPRGFEPGGFKVKVWLDPNTDYVNFDIELLREILRVEKGK